MPSLSIDAVSVTARDMAKSVKFYALLGFDFAGVDTTAEHVEPLAAPGAVRLMIDRAELMEKLIGEAPRPSNHAHFALLCASPAEVDECAASVTSAGFDVTVEPWDAFWGQRYATVADPDGYRIDLFAPL